MFGCICFLRIYKVQKVSQYFLDIYEKLLIPLNFIVQFNLESQFVKVKTCIICERIVNILWVNSNGIFIEYKPYKTSKRIVYMNSKKT